MIGAPKSQTDWAYEGLKMARGNKDMAGRRKMRQLEARRDALMESTKKTKIALAEVRAALRTMRKSP